VRVKVEGPKDLKATLEDQLTDPRVGYSVGVGGRCSVALVSSPFVFVDGDGGLHRHVVRCIRELTSERVAVGDGPLDSLTVGVPSGQEEPVLRGVLRGLMRFGKHGLPNAVDDSSPSLLAGLLNFGRR
jgi:hypothetical protein